MGVKFFFLLRVVAIAVNGLWCVLAVADGAALPLIPRISIDGLMGNQGLAGGDMMAPLYGNPDAIFFFDIQGKTAFSTASVISFGGGFRSVQQEDRILGVYVFADRSLSNQYNAFWFVSPGLESMGRIWDFRVNGYFPTGAQRAFAGSGFADEFGNYSYVSFSGHDQLDVIVNNFEGVGWGVDGEIGRRVPFIPLLRAYVGGYHFNMNNADNINGVAGRLEYPLSRLLSVSVSDSYDNNQHNTLEAALRLTLGGVNTAPRDPHQPIQQRLLDPISRNLATLGEGNGEPIVSQQEVVSNANTPVTPVTPVVERSDIWFFDPNSSTEFVDVNSCTAEHPCSSAAFNQDTINSINSLSLGPNAAFYFKPGAYSALTDGNPDVLTDDSLYSRTPDYKAPQRGAIFSGAFIINGLSELNAITLYNDANFIQPIGLTLNSGATVLLDNSVIGSVINNIKQAYPTAIKMTDSHLIVANHTEIYAYSNSSTPAIGIDAEDNTGSTITLTDNCIVRASVLGLTSTVDYSAMGIATQSSSGVGKVNIGDGCSVSASALGNFGIFNLVSIAEAEQNNQLSVSGNSVLSADITVTYGPTISVTGVEMAGAVNNLQVSGSQIDAKATIVTGSPNIQTSLNTTGIDVSGNNNTISITANSQVSSSLSTPYAQHASAEGIQVNDQGAGATSVTVDDSQIQVDADLTNLISLSSVYAVATQGIYIDTNDVTSSFTNTVNLINNSTLAANNSVTNADLAVGYANNIFSEGIAIGPEPGVTAANNLNNTVNVHNSSVSASALIANGAAIDPNVVTAIGIDLVSGGNSTQAVNISNSASVQAQAQLVNGGDYYNTVSATGVTLIAGSTSSNTLDLSLSSTVQADAAIENGGNYNNQTTANGIEVAAGNSSSNTLTVGSNVTANATIQQSGANAANSALVYGINVYNTAGNVTNTITLQGASIISATADIVNGSIGLGTNSAASTGVYVSGADNMTTLKDTSSIVASSSATGAGFSAIATGIESVAPLGPTNVVDNQVDPGGNSNIQALENGLNTGTPISQHN